MKELIRWFVFSMIIWIVFFSAGWWLAPGELTSSDIDIARTLVGTNSLSPFQFRTIITSNSLMIIQLGFGLITAGITTIISLILNSFTTGGVIGNAFKSGFLIPEILRVTLPHSLEFIAVWLAASSGLRGFPYAMHIFARRQYPSYQQLRTDLTILAVSLLIIWVAAVLEYKISMGR